MEDKRLDKIEEKIDELARLVAELARIEERMISLFKRMDRFDGVLLNIEMRITELEKLSIRRGAIYAAVDKVFWLMAGGAVATFFAKFGMK